MGRECKMMNSDEGEREKIKGRGSVRKKRDIKIEWIKSEKKKEDKERAREREMNGQRMRKEKE
jgi:hypothetical protein